ncbi:glycosyltransferase 87 family protein [Allokutzneria sp. NRRL B-24872]|uniref:glycosyltransferase 87 family protein n=1 Tax=Allokutzneria sp. NRRL B-24872 TaxID=1137961 RepID=UPI000A3D3E4E|nr:glycosyltransferase 87 family protein [Allokutzneria sp. NRRL B-24872]
MLLGLVRHPVVAVVGIAGALFLALRQVSTAPIVDLDVFRAGGEAWLAGRGLFDAEFPPRPLLFPLPFIYPPIAAVLFSGFTMLPLVTLGQVMTVATVLALVAACVVTARRCGLDRAAAWGVGAVVGLVMVDAEPVRSTIDLGQVNVLLMALVVLDCLLTRTPWPRGLLIGIAAGIKLTPLAFLLFFAFSGRWRVVLTAASTFTATVLLGFLLAAGNSWQYWTSTVFKLDTMVGAGFATNQSLRAVLARFGMDKAESFPFWLAGVALVLSATWFVVRRLLAEGAENPERAGIAEVQAMLMIATATLLCSPISWSNHWVWVAVPAAGLAASLLRTPRWCLAVPALVLTVFFLGPHIHVPSNEGREEHWTLGEWFLGNAFVLTAATSLVAVVVVLARRARAAAGRVAVLQDGPR